MKETGELYSRKIKELLGEEGVDRLVKVSREVNTMRRKLKRDYFDQRLVEIGGDMRATWEVLGGEGDGEVGRRRGTLRMRGVVSPIG